MHCISKSFLRDLEKHKKNSDFTDVEQYHINCFDSYRAINTSIKKLKIAEELIAESYIFIEKSKEYSLGEYIEFNIESYMIRSRSVYDRI